MTSSDFSKRNDHTGTSTLENILAPRRASIKAISCGVETINAPVQAEYMLPNQSHVLTIK
jgi:hypothetical protein